jgi:hypothetical protein
MCWMHWTYNPLDAAARVANGGRMSEWISTENRLPQEFEYVLLLRNTEQWVGCLQMCEDIDHIKHNVWWCHDPNSDAPFIVILPAPTHWMRLQEPPKEGE